MKSILDFLRLEMKQTAYYLGTFFWAVGILFGELSKSKKNAIDSGMASQESFAVLGYTLASFFFFALALILLFSVLHKLRNSFARHQPSLWDFGISWTWMSIKVATLTCLTLIPAFAYALTNYMTSITNPIRFASITGGLVVIFIPVWFVLYHGATALVAARGHSHHSTRDSWKAFRAIWKGCLLALLLQAAPSLLLLFPVRMLSFRFSGLEYVAIGLSVCLAPYQFGMMAAVQAYLGKLITERAPDLLATKSAENS